MPSKYRRIRTRKQKEEIIAGLWWDLYDVFPRCSVYPTVDVHPSSPREVLPSYHLAGGEVLWEDHPEIEGEKSRAEDTKINPERCPLERDWQWQLRGWPDLLADTESGGPRIFSQNTRVSLIYLGPGPYPPHPDPGGTATPRKGRGRRGRLVVE